ncbi:MAG: hypothetical protein JW781_05440 [Deltaproteobacteria bacterium]|nr:hypothetical protein [Candidatus Anaeroferrophillacea bacterium]
MRSKNWCIAADRLRLLPLLWVLLLAAGCAGRRLPPPVLPAAPAAAATAWKLFVPLEDFEARGVIRLAARDGTRHASRVQIAGRYPSRLEIRWLTPWQTTAWRLLLVEREFWLTDADNGVTRHGFAAARTAAAAAENGDGFLAYAGLLADWALLFAPPDGFSVSGGAPAAGDTADRPRTTFLVDGDGLPAGKIIRFAAGREWHVTYDRLLETPDGRFPERLTLCWRGGSLEISWPVVRFDPITDRDRFRYRDVGEFELREVMNSGNPDN